MNVFKNKDIAIHYDSFYQTDLGKKIDILEKNAVQQLIADITPCKMLEIGCGTGHWTKFFSDKGFTIVAIDNSEEMLAIAKKKTIQQATFILADAENIPFTAQTFSFIATVTTLEFVSDIHKVISEIKRVITPGGILLIGALNADSMLFNNIEKESVFQHAILRNKAEWLSLLSQLGRIEYVETVFINEKHQLFDSSSHLESAFIAFKVFL